MKFENSKKKNCNKPGARAKRKTEKLEKKFAKEEKKALDETLRKNKVEEKMQEKQKRNKAA